MFFSDALCDDKIVGFGSNKQNNSKYIRSRLQIERGYVYGILILVKKRSTKINCSPYGALHGGNAELVSFPHHSKFLLDS